MSSGRLPQDSSYRKLIEQRRLRDTARTNTQPSVAWEKLNANWIRGKGREEVEGGGGEIGLNTKKQSTKGKRLNGTKTSFRCALISINSVSLVLKRELLVGTKKHRRGTGRVGGGGGYYVEQNIHVSNKSF